MYLLVYTRFYPLFLKSDLVIELAKDSVLSAYTDRGASLFFQAELNVRIPEGIPAWYLGR